MKIQVHCPACSTTMSAPEEAAGKRVKCLKCKSILVVPSKSEPYPKSAQDEPSNGKATGSSGKTKQATSQKQQPDSRSRRGTLMAVAAVAILLIGGGAGYYFFIRPADDPKTDPKQAPPALTEQQLKDELFQSLAESEWGWGKGVQFKSDRYLWNVDWQAGGMLVRWEPVDRRTVLLLLERGRKVDRHGVLTFSEDLREFSGIDLEAATLTSMKRVPGTEAKPPVVSSFSVQQSGTKAELTKLLVGSHLEWGKGVELKADGYAKNVDWEAGGLEIRWEAIDRRTILLTVEKGREHDRCGVLTFTEDLNGFSGVGLEYGPKLNARNHPATTPAPKAGDNRAVAAVREKLLGRWNEVGPLPWSVEFKANGDAIWLRNNEPKNDAKYTFSLEDEKTLKSHFSREGGTGSMTYEIQKLTDTELILVWHAGEAHTTKYTRAK